MYMPILDRKYSTDIKVYREEQRTLNKEKCKTVYQVFKIAANSIQKYMYFILKIDYGPILYYIR